MIIYRETKVGFIRDCFQHDIEEVLTQTLLARTGRRVSRSEIGSWRNSLMYMAKVLNDSSIADNSGVGLEYFIPQTSNRIDVLLTGYGADKSPQLLIVELKQWQSARATRKDGVVITQLGWGERETSHPSYQAWSYAEVLCNFNEAVYNGHLRLQPCAYLHNYKEDGVISDSAYEPYITEAPLFFKGEPERTRLRSFIARHLTRGDDLQSLYDLENGRIRPSKGLVDALVGMLEGKREFVLIDRQKVVYESALAAADAAKPEQKQVLIVRGGPGTGKSVIAINLLVELTKRRKTCRYVSKNAAPRAVYKSVLTGSVSRSRMDAMFSGSGVFVDWDRDPFDVLIVDEAHRLNEHSGLYGNEGENQIKEIIAACNCAIFFVDENQLVTLKDIGRTEEIERWATAAGATILHDELESQFRCNGSDGYLAWLDEVLGIRETANWTLAGSPFDFAVMDDPDAVRAWVNEENKKANRARMVAGYCWKWASKKDPDEFDVVIPEYNFKMRWNLSSDGSLWMVAPTSVEEIGCIHTSQGLEVDSIGVIIGPDLVVRDGIVVTRPEFRASSDKSIHGYKTWAKKDPQAANAAAAMIIKNTYRTLMTRGMRSCRIFCTDSETRDYFRSRMGQPCS